MRSPEFPGLESKFFRGNKMPVLAEGSHDLFQLRSAVKC